MLWSIVGRSVAQQRLHFPVVVERQSSRSSVSETPAGVWSDSVLWVGDTNFYFQGSPAIESHTKRCQRKILVMQDKKNTFLPATGKTKKGQGETI